LILLAAPAALAGDLLAMQFPAGVDPNFFIRVGPNDFSHFGDRLAEETYQQHGAEVVPWTQETALPSSDNAALLYYQAFLLRPQPDDATFLAINDVLRGGGPDRQIRVYLGKCRGVIHTVEVASRIPQCAWGIRHPDSFRFSETYLLGEIRQLALVLDLDARTLGADGHYDAALARCLTMRRLARHVGDDMMVAYLVSLAADSLARGTMQHVLGLMPPDADVLQRLRGQLAVVSGAPGSLAKGMQADLDLLIERMGNDPNLLEWIRQELAKNATDQQAREQASDLTDDDVLALAREPYQCFLRDVFQVLDSEMSYEQKYTELNRQSDKLIEDYGDNPAASPVMGYSYVYTRSIAELYTLSLRNAAGYNALKAAIDVYLIRAQTGQLPEVLPPYSPKDLFSGQDFEYEITPTGFILRCQARDIYEDKIWEYEFLVQD
jgi:hypothetical protein